MLRGREYRRKAKREAVEYLGGECKLCGYRKNIKALEFHHLDPNLKEFSISKAGSGHWNFDRIKKELDLCILLCANCHREVHDEQIV